MPRSAPQSVLRHPLTTILGAEANVRLLRELCLHGGQLAAPDLVRRTGLARASVWSALAALEAAGIVAVAGHGRARLYSTRRSHRLRPDLEALFEAEAARFDAMIEAARDAARSSGPGPRAIWLHGSVLSGQDRAGSDLDLAVAAPDAEISAVLEIMSKALLAAGDELGFQPSLIGNGWDELAEQVRRRSPLWTGILRDGALLWSRDAPDGLTAAAADEVPSRHAA